MNKAPVQATGPALQGNSRLGWEGLAGTNALAYSASSSVTEKEEFLYRWH